MNQGTQIWVSADQMQATFELYRGEPVLRMCRDVIFNTLFSKGLHIVQGSKEATRDFTSHLNEHWIPFAKDVFDHTLMWGFCPYLLTKVKTPKNLLHKTVRIPVVPTFNTYKIEVVLNDKTYQRHLSFHPFTNFPNVQQKEKDKKVHFLTLTLPDSLGNLHSKAVTLLHGFRLSRELFDHAMHVEHLKAHPTLITQESTHKRADNEVIAMDMFADGDALMEKEEASYLKTKERLKDFQRQQNMAMVLNGKRARDRNIRIDPLTGAPIRTNHTHPWQDNLFSLPDGQVMAPCMNPSSRTDLLEIERHRVDTMCGVMGVPKSLVLAEGRGGSATGSTASDVTYKMFMRSLDGTRNLICRLLEMAYENIYDEKVTMTLPYLPLTNMEDLWLLVEKGITTREKIGIYMLQVLGLPENLLDITETNAAEDEPPEEEPPLKRKKKEEV